MPDPAADEAQQPPAPPADAAPRRTAMAVAQAAEDLATALQDVLDDKVLPELAGLRSDLTAGLQEAAGFAEGANRKLREMADELAALNDPKALHDEQEAITDQITDQVKHAMAPFLARLEAVERTTASAVASPALLAAGDGDLDHILERVAALERELSVRGAINDAPPVVHGKVLELMKAVNQIGKDRKAAKEMGGYMFRGIDQVLDAVGSAVRQVGLTLETKVLERDYTTDQARNSEGKTLLWTSCRLVIAYTFVAPEDGSRHTFEMAGEARATDDKSTSKAESMALKYGLLHALMIPVEGMADGDGESPQVFTEDRDRPVQGNTADQPRPPAASPPPNTPPATDQASRQERARDALAALRHLGKVAPAERHRRLAAIRGQIESEGLGNAEIEGATLRAHGAAIFQTLPADPSEQPAQGEF
jgi:hypothetical protein